MGNTNLTRNRENQGFKKNVIPEGLIQFVSLLSAPLGGDEALLILCVCLKTDLRSLPGYSFLHVAENIQVAISLTRVNMYGSTENHVSVDDGFKCSGITCSVISTNSSLESSLSLPSSCTNHPQYRTN